MQRADGLHLFFGEHTRPPQVEGDGSLIAG
jgi:hypothetical protein